MDETDKPVAIETEKPRSVAAAVERLFAAATEALNRASKCDDPGWEKFYLGQATAYSEWARQMEPVALLQTRIDEQVKMLRARLKLPPLPQRGATHAPPASRTEPGGSGLD